MASGRLTIILATTTHDLATTTGSSDHLVSLILIGHDRVREMKGVTHCVSLIVAPRRFREEALFLAFDPILVQ